jgi:hypothetical protein
MTTTIYSALVKAQQAFGPALKTSANPHFKSLYADLATCVDAVMDSLNANGIYLLQRTLDCESGVKVETVFLHESGESMTCGVLHVPAAKEDPQGYGSALTYARRYSLMAACGIAPEDDDGNAGSKKPPTTKPAPSTPKPTANFAKAGADMLQSLRDCSLVGRAALEREWSVWKEKATTGNEIDVATFEAIWSEHKRSLLDAAKKADADATKAP